MFESLHSAVESKSSGQQNEHHEVGEQSREPNDLEIKL